MRKFGDVYKEKLIKSEQLHESKIVDDFKKIYNSLLEHYNLTAIHDLNEKSQLAFLTELNQYWSEENGLSELGENFLKKKEARLTENSTPLQKKNFLKSRAYILLSETMRQSDMKYKMYTIIDEMYQQVKAESINDVLSPNMISNIITEAFSESLDDFISIIRTEISESNKEEDNEESKAKMVNESKKPKVYIRKKK